MISKKTPGWQIRLVEYLRTVAATPLRPGEHDCGLFFGRGVEIMTGLDYTTPFRGKYRKIEDGLKMLQDMGFENHVEYAASILPELPSVLFAQRGDGAVVEENGGFSLGIVQGENVYVVGMNGLAIVPLTRATRTFRV